VLATVIVFSFVILIVFAVVVLPHLALLSVVCANPARASGEAGSVVVVWHLVVGDG
jgi:hypothetical protein